jgi:hypothetical protein
MTADHRTYRVPKRVVRKVQDAVMGGVEGADLAAVRVAEALMGDRPVDVAVPRAVVTFFSRDWRSHPAKAGIAGLYGGTTGLEWARKCAGDLEPVVAAVDEADEEYGDLAGYDHSDVEGMLNYGKRASVDSSMSEEDEEEALFAALLAELEGITPGAEVIVAEEAAQEPPPGAEVFSEDGEDSGDDEVRQMTVAAMRDAVSAASATLAAEGAAPAGDAAAPKAPPQDPRAPLW